MRTITIPVIFTVAQDEIIDTMALIDSITVDVEDNDEIIDVEVSMNYVEEAA